LLRHPATIRLEAVRQGRSAYLYYSRYLCLPDRDLDRASATPTLPLLLCPQPPVASNPYGGPSGNRYPPSIPTLAPEGPLTNDQVNYIIQRLKDIILNNRGGLGPNGGAPRQLQPILPPPTAYRTPYSNGTACVTRLRHPVAVNSAER